jgi:hypothetical protein
MKNSGEHISEIKIKPEFGVVSRKEKHMVFDDVLSMKERAHHCLHNCYKRGKANCFECEKQVALEEIIELCDKAEESRFD